MAGNLFDHQDPKYTIPGLEDADSDVLEVCGGFNPEYFRERYASTLMLASGMSTKDLVAFYIANGGALFLNPHPYFNEAAYRGSNVDVDDMVRRAAFRSGYHHWLLVGCHENRAGREAAQGSAGDERAIYSEARVSSIVRTRPRLERAAEASSETDLNVASQFAAETSLGSTASNEAVQGTNTSDWAIADVSSEHRRLVDVINRSGIFNAHWYLRRHPDIRAAGVDPVLHYVQFGHAEGRIVHPFFDAAFYCRQAFDASTPSTLPLVHYIQIGSRRGLKPHVAFDPAAFCVANYLDALVQNPLAHYFSFPISAMSVAGDGFDPAYYLADNPDIAQAGVAPFEHFLYQGVHEGRRPNSDFDTHFYFKTHLGSDYTQNAYLHWLELGKAAGLATSSTAGDAPTVSREVAHFSSPGPMFEKLDPSIANGQRRRAKIFAFYLPQFHAFPENDEWWGDGFTEWRNIPRGLPRFVGHYQPRIPRDLGYYSLNDTTILRRQAEMARKMGITGFGFYFYWFNQKRLMERPLEAFLGDSTIDLPFYLIWANENWTRRWDGLESEVLIRQDCAPEDDIALIDCFQRHFDDARYLKLDNRPLLVIYRADCIPDTAATLTRWRALFRSRHGSEPLIYMAQSFGLFDPRDHGFDGAIEFPPHKVTANMRPIYDKVEMLDSDFRGNIVDYDAVIAASLNEADPEFPLIKTVYPSWDNNARRPSGGLITANATPGKYQAWLDGAISFAERKPVEGQPLVFINAWNEWAEGAYLEPDIYYGSAYLNATARAATAEDARFRGEKYKVVLVGHDAFRAGAQLNLLHKAKILQDRFGVDVRVVLLGGGDMEQDYRDSVSVVVTTPQDSLAVFAKLHDDGFRRAILNTTVTGFVATVLKERGWSVTALVHELPRLLGKYNLAPHADAFRRDADVVVFATQTIADEFETYVGKIEGRRQVLAQGAYQTFARDTSARMRIRTELGLSPDAKIVLNVGYADLRKGVDRFCRVAELVAERRSDVTFVWAGNHDPEAARWIVADSVAGKRNAAVRFVGQRGDIADLMNAADVFFLSSREDPFPSVVLEALQVGVPVVAIEKSGGIDDLLRDREDCGTLVDASDAQGTINAILGYVDNIGGISSRNVAAREALIRNEFDYPTYVFELLRTLYPELLKVSVVVPSYNYEGYIGARLQSVFDQTYPVFEIIVVDDASRDDSRSVIERTIARTGRQIRKIFNRENSGSVYNQWKTAGRIATGDLLWIAEADDLAAPTLVERLATAHTNSSDIIFAFSDSRAIDQNGWLIYESYKAYAATEGRDVLQEDEVFIAADFARRVIATKNLVLNGSAVLWNTVHFQRALEAVEPMLSKLKLAGDWLLYAQACRAVGRIAYLADPLNVHRRHSSSVTTTIDAERHADEILKMHQTLGSFFSVNPSIVLRQQAYREQVAAQLHEAAARS